MLLQKWASAFIEKNYYLLIKERLDHPQTLVYWKLKCSNQLQSSASLQDSYITTLKYNAYYSAG